MVCSSNGGLHILMERFLRAEVFSAWAVSAESTGRFCAMLCQSILASFLDDGEIMVTQHIDGRVLDKMIASTSTSASSLALCFGMNCNQVFLNGHDK
jgi:hypothetical protein